MDELRAIIFDCDGVIADTEPVHYAAFARALSEHGVSLSRQEYYEHCLGYDDAGVFVHAFAHAGKQLGEQLWAELLEQKRRLYLEMIERDLAPLPGVQQLVRSAAKHWPLAIYSGAIRCEVDLVVQRLGLDGCFKAIVTSEDVSAGKPDPEGYVLALERLREAAPLEPPLQARECLVIEDSLPGIDAAHAADMRVLAVTTSHPPEQLGSAQAVVDSLEGVDLELCRSLFAR